MRVARGEEVGDVGGDGGGAGGQLADLSAARPSGPKPEAPTIQAKAGALRRPPLPCRASPPLGGRSDVGSAFANLKGCKENAFGQAANLPPRGGD
ncbi:hypothetical protein EN920_07700, partial [Mesorhizobium sp. M7A.F.Ca.CA.004.09.1.2]